MIEQLQFLRPEWFYAFIPLLIFIIMMLRRPITSVSWKSVCDHKLLPHVLTHAQNRTSRFPLLLVFIGAGATIIALAGPVWDKLPQPVYSDKSALVIALDLSRSMDAGDLPPSRLARARLKLQDIIRARKGGQTALIVYASGAYTVTPLTEDINTLLNMVPALETQLMPGQGSRADSALHLGADLLHQAGVISGDILLVTDDAGDEDIAVAEDIRAQGHRISVLAVGTLEGAPIPLSSGGFLTDNNGAIVIPRLGVSQLQQLAGSGDGIYVALRADDSDVNRLMQLYNTRKLNTETEQSELNADVWREQGPWLLLLVIPLAALWPRKGWLACFALILLPVTEPAYAISADALWLNQNQRAQQAFDGGDNAEAAQLFEHPEWKASAYYRAGEYEKAIEALENAGSSDAFYNKGNALAKLGRYQEAIEAYERALELDAGNEDAAYNRQLVEQALQQQDPEQQPSSDRQPGQSQQSDEQQQSQQQQQSSDNAENRQQDERQQDPQQQNPQQQNPQQQAADSEQQQQENEQQTLSEQDDNAEPQQENEQQPQAMNPEQEYLSEKEQATEQWLKRIPDDPGGLLRRKFLYQYNQMPDRNKSEQAW